MILVEVYVAAMDETYDFMLDEHAGIGQIIGELSEMLSKKVKYPIPDKGTPFMLCSMDQKEILPEEKTLAGCKIKDGHKLLLV